ncbi:MAG: 50S ribosomal protein L4 [Candidatus Bathyarchaeia archaeon]
MPTTKKTLHVYDLQGNPTTTTTLPLVFTTPIRPDVIKRAVLAIQSHKRQPQGRDPMAGKRTTAESRGTGMAISRVPRIKSGSGRAKFAPSTVGGRQPHPPTTQKKITKRIPKKEKHLALQSAIAATASKETIIKRGHVITNIPQIPLIVTDQLQELTQTKQLEETLTKLGLQPELQRIRNSKNTRPGKGKRRGRKTKQAKGPLIVITENHGVIQAATNIPGIQVTKLKDLNPELLAPGTHPGRLTIWTKSAIEQLHELTNKQEGETT